MNKIKCLQYYFDSKTYTDQQIEEKIEETKKEFPKSRIDVGIKLNEFGVYIVTLYVENKETYLSKVMSKYRTKKVKLLKEGSIEKKKQSRLQKYYSNSQGKNKNYHPVELKDYNEPRKYGDWQQAKKYKKYINKI